MLPEFLESLAETLPPSLAYELIVVDNASTDETLRILDADRHAQVISLQENRGFAAGINAGIRNGGTADAVLVLNPDIRLRPHAVTHLLDAVSGPDIGIAVPRMLTRDGALSYSLRREPTVFRALGEALLGGNRAGRFQAFGETISRADRYELPGPVDWATGAAMMISRPCLDAVGPWDESFFLYSEETDFALRARDAGFSVHYTPSAEMIHLGGASSPRLRVIRTENRIRLYRRRHGRGRTAMFRGAVILNEALRAMTGSAAHAAALRSLVVRTVPRRVRCFFTDTPSCKEAG